MWLCGGVLYMIAAWAGRPPWFDALLKEKRRESLSQLVVAGFIWIGASVLAWPVFLAARVLLWFRRRKKGS
jgi:hypothetical protein